MPPVPAPDGGSTTPSRRLILLAVGTAAATATSFAKSALADIVIDIPKKSLTAASFVPLIDKYFLVSDGDATTQLKLLRVTEHPRGGKRPNSLPNPFSLIFSSPWSETLPSQIYETENPAIGRVMMFITPVAKHLYEAPFN